MNGWSIIQRFLNPPDAYMAKSLLESEGIETLLQDELTTQIGYGIPAIDGVKLLIKNEDMQRGRQILEKGGYLIGADDAEGEDWVWVKKKEGRRYCPFCRSVQIRKCKHENKVTAVVYFMLGIFSPWFRLTWKCEDCGKAWKYK